VSREAIARALVAGQFAAIGAWLWAGPWLAPWPALVAVQAVGVALGAWAAVHMTVRQRRAFSVTPLPDRHDRLVTDGPYRRIRHPMYTAVLAVVLPAALAGPPAALVAGLALAAVLHVKLRFEEHQLAQRFPEYAAYMARSGALLPWPGRGGRAGPRPGA
jgi:protein-S-isoprenylcysteine O-methyltransferase Ste14